MKNRIKATKDPTIPKMTNGIVKQIIVEEYTSIQWFNKVKRVGANVETADMIPRNMHPFTMKRNYF